MSLLSAAELGAIQSVAQSGMTTTATILTRATVETDDGQESVWADAGDTVCWVRQILGDSSTLGAVSGAVASAQLVNVRVPIGTVIAGGDHLGIDGDLYTVEAGNQSDTYPAWWEFACRLLE